MSEFSQEGNERNIDSVISAMERGENRLFETEQGKSEMETSTEADKIASLEETRMNTAEDPACDISIMKQNYATQELESETVNISDKNSSEEFEATSETKEQNSGKEDECEIEISHDDSIRDIGSGIAIASENNKAEEKESTSTVEVTAGTKNGNVEELGSEIAEKSQMDIAGTEEVDEIQMDSSTKDQIDSSTKDNLLEIKMTKLNDDQEELGSDHEEMSSKDINERFKISKDINDKFRILMETEKGNADDTDPVRTISDATMDEESPAQVNADVEIGGKVAETAENNAIEKERYEITETVVMDSTENDGVQKPKQNKRQVKKPKKTNSAAQKPKKGGRQKKSKTETEVIVTSEPKPKKRKTNNSLSSEFIQDVDLCIEDILRAEEAEETGKSVSACAEGEVIADNTTEGVDDSDAIRPRKRRQPRKFGNVVYNAEQGEEEEVYSDDRDEDWFLDDVSSGEEYNVNQLYKREKKKRGTKKKGDNYVKLKELKVSLVPVDPENYLNDRNASKMVDVSKPSKSKAAKKPITERLKLNLKQKKRREKVKKQKVKLNVDYEKVTITKDGEKVKMYKCMHCSYTNKYECALRQHNLVHTVPSYKCKFCDFTTRSKQIHMEHEAAKHTREKPFACDKCDYRSVYRVDLHHHQAKHLDEKKFRCPVDGCDFITKWRRNIAHHMRKHETARPFKCHKCPLAFKRQQDLNTHLYRHSDDKPLQCDQCNYRCKTNYEIKMHKLVHSDIRPYGCTYPGCTQRCKVKSDLVKHMLIHTKERKFLCTLCGKGYKSQTALNKHARQHSDLRPFICDLCGKGFKYKAGLRTHLKNHQGIKPFDCEVCGHLFSNKSNRDKHMVTHNFEDRPLRCPLCPYAAKIKDHLLAHIGTMHGQSYAFFCELCKKPFQRYFQLTVHHSRMHTQAEFARYMNSIGINVDQIRREVKVEMVEEGLISQEEIGAMQQTLQNQTESDEEEEALETESREESREGQNVVDRQETESSVERQEDQTMTEHQESESREERQTLAEGLANESRVESEEPFNRNERQEVEGTEERTEENGKNMEKSRDNDGIDARVEDDNEDTEQRQETLDGENRQSAERNEEMQASGNTETIQRSDGNESVEARQDYGKSAEKDGETQSSRNTEILQHSDSNGSVRQSDGVEQSRRMDGEQQAEPRQAGRTESEEENEADNSDSDGTDHSGGSQTLLQTIKQEPPPETPFGVSATLAIYDDFRLPLFTRGFEFNVDKTGKKPDVWFMDLDNMPSEARWHQQRYLSRLEGYNEARARRYAEKMAMMESKCDLETAIAKGLIVRRRGRHSKKDKSENEGDNDKGKKKSESLTKNGKRRGRPPKNKDETPKNKDEKSKGMDEKSKGMDEMSEGVVKSKGKQPSKTVGKNKKKATTSKKKVGKKAKEPKAKRKVVIEEVSVPTTQVNSCVAEAANVGFKGQSSGDCVGTKKKKGLPPKSKSDAVESSVKKQSKLTQTPLKKKPSKKKKLETVVQGLQKTKSKNGKQKKGKGSLKLKLTAVKSKGWTVSDDSEWHITGKKGKKSTPKGKGRQKGSAKGKRSQKGQETFVIDWESADSQHGTSEQILLPFELKTEETEEPMTASEIQQDMNGTLSINQEMPSANFYCDDVIILKKEKPDDGDLPFGELAADDRTGEDLLKNADTTESLLSSTDILNEDKVYERAEHIVGMTEQNIVVSSSENVRVCHNMDVGLQIRNIAENLTSDSAVMDSPVKVEPL